MRNPENEGRAPGESVIPDGERACLWMQAGVIAQWLCDLDFHCERCPLDAALRHEHGELAKLQLSPGLPELAGTEAIAPGERTTGIASLEAASSTVPGNGPGATETPSSDLAASERDGAAGPEDLLNLQIGSLDPRLLYHRGHTWVHLEASDRARVGLDAFATRIAGRPRSVVVPHPGAQLRRGRPCAWIDLVGGTLTVLAPISGTVIETNAEIAVTPALLESDPFGRGWLFAVQPSDSARDLRRLEDAPTFTRRLERDLDAWRRRVHRDLRPGWPHLGETLQDGGVRVENLDDLLGPRRRYEIALYFLGAGRCLR